VTGTGRTVSASKHETANAEEEKSEAIMRSVANFIGANLRDLQASGN
jgi:hypothetical protein